MAEFRTVEVFLCYRQVDGSRVAEWLNSKLDGLTFGEGANQSKLAVYFDQAAIATSDWKAVHRPSLERAQALIFVSTPGALSRVDGEDWVHMELEWWIRHRDTAPLVVDATGEGDRWIPKSVREKWPDIQRVPVTPDLLADESDQSRSSRVVGRLIDGIRYSDASVLFEDVAQKRQLLKRSRYGLLGAIGAAILAVIGLWFALSINAQLSDALKTLDAARSSINDILFVQRLSPFPRLPEQYSAEELAELQALLDSWKEDLEASKRKLELGVSSQSSVLMTSYGLQSIDAELSWAQGEFERTAEIMRELVDITDNIVRRSELELEVGLITYADYVRARSDQKAARLLRMKMDYLVASGQLDALAPLAAE